MFVYVLNQHGKSLMPCTPAKARKLLNSNKAIVLKKTPFTIQLLYGSSGYTQSVNLGVDAGSKHIGLSATTDTKVLFEAQVDLRTDIVKLLSARRAFRCTRRSRKTRYRKVRFLNRRKPKGWLAPSIKNKIENHLKVVKLVYSILPIKRTIVEVAQFDIQAIKNPGIEGKEYQEGDQMGFWNVREYVFWRDGHQCQHCKGKSKDVILNVHHIESRKTGGNAPNNLVTLCETCHDKYHQGEIELKLKRGQSFRDAAFMGIMRWACFNHLKEIYTDVFLTYGYITKNKRIREGLKKSHMVDARCISDYPRATPMQTTYLVKQVRGQNRQLHKATILKGGVRKANKAPRYVKGFQLFDKVRYEGVECFIFGRRSSGSFDIRLLDGTKIHAGISFKKLTLIEKATSLLFERKRGTALLPIVETRGIRA
jgi:Restriction endonuclease